MGAWSSSLYGNDMTCDVRDAYMKFLKEQLSNEEVYEKTMETFNETIGGDEEPLLWFALTETQWKVVMGSTTTLERYNMLLKTKSRDNSYFTFTF